MRHSLSILILLGFSLAIFVAQVAGIDPQTKVGVTEALTDGDQENAQALKEIGSIREKLGGSVLQGSILDSRDDAEFDDGLRNLLELPQQKSDSLKLTQPQIVVMLRRHSSRLDGIANQIEMLRQYNNADQLRDMAGQLRLVARQMDAPIAGGEKEAIR